MGLPSGSKPPARGPTSPDLKGSGCPPGPGIPARGTASLELGGDGCPFTPPSSISGTPLAAYQDRRAARAAGRHP